MYEKYGIANLYEFIYVMKQRVQGITVLRSNSNQFLDTLYQLEFVIIVDSDTG